VSHNANIDEDRSFNHGGNVKHCLFQLHSSTAQGQADWNLCNTFSYACSLSFMFSIADPTLAMDMDSLRKIKDIQKKEYMVIIGLS